MKCSEGCHCGGARWESRMSGLKSWGNVNRRNGCAKEVVGQPLCLERRYELGWGVVMWMLFALGVWFAWADFESKSWSSIQMMRSYYTFLPDLHVLRGRMGTCLGLRFSKRHAIKVGLRGKIWLAKVTSLFLTFTASASALSSPPTMTK